VDASGRLPPDLLDTPTEVAFDGQPDLARAIAGSPRAPACHALFWLTFAVPSLAPEGTFKVAAEMNQGYPPPALAEVLARFLASGQDLRELIVAITTSPAFLAP
jgi:hypothetical protein